MNRKAAFIAFALVALMASAHVATADEDPTMNDSKFCCLHIARAL